MKNNDPILNFLKLRGYTGIKLKTEYAKLKNAKVTLPLLIETFIKNADNDSNSISCHKCVDRYLKK